MKRPLNRNAFNRLGQHAPVSRDCTVRVHGGKASRTGALFSKDEIEYQDSTGVHKITFFESSEDDFGHLVGTDGVEIAGTCAICGRWVCSSPGCAHTCADHGYRICAHHAVSINGRVVCTKHRAGHMAKSAAIAVARPILGLVGAILRNYGGIGKP